MTDSDRVQLTSLNYSSPGVVCYKVPEAQKKSFLATYNYFRDNRKDVAEANKLLLAYLREHKRSPSNQSQDSNTLVSPEVENHLWVLSLNVWKSINQLEMGQRIRNRTGGPYRFAKITRWYVQRLANIDNFAIDGKASIPELDFEEDISSDATIDEN